MVKPIGAPDVGISPLSTGSSSASGAGRTRAAPPVLELTADSRIITRDLQPSPGTGPAAAPSSSSTPTSGPPPTGGRGQVFDFEV